MIFLKKLENILIYDIKSMVVYHIVVMSLQCSVVAFTSRNCLESYLLSQELLNFCQLLLPTNSFVA